MVSNFQTLKCYSFSILLTWVNLTMSVAQEQTIEPGKQKLEAVLAFLHIFRLLNF